MIAASVTKLKLIGSCAICKRQNLMSQTDTENGVSALKFSYRLYYRNRILRVTRSVGYEDSVRLQCLNGLYISIIWHNSNLKPLAKQ